MSELTDRYTNCEPYTHAPRRITPSDGIPSQWAGHANRLRQRLETGNVRVYIRNADRPDDIRVLIDGASLRRLTADNAESVEREIVAFADRMRALLGDPE